MADTEQELIDLLSQPITSLPQIFNEHGIRQNALRGTKLFSRISEEGNFLIVGDLAINDKRSLVRQTDIHSALVKQLTELFEIYNTSFPKYEKAVHNVRRKIPASQDELDRCELDNEYIQSVSLSGYAFKGKTMIERENNMRAALGYEPRSYE